MNWIKHQDKRVNLDNIVYFEPVDFKKRFEDGGDVRPVFAIRFVYIAPVHEVNFEFFTIEERENFLRSIDQDLFTEMV